MLEGASPATKTSSEARIMVKTPSPPRKRAVTACTSPAASPCDVELHTEIENDFDRGWTRDGLKKGISLPHRPREASAVRAHASERLTIQSVTQHLSRTT